MCCSVLQCVAVCCIAFQCVAVCCSAFQVCCIVFPQRRAHVVMLLCVAVSGSELQCVTLCSVVSQCVAVLQCTLNGREGRTTTKTSERIYTNQ